MAGSDTLAHAARAGRHAESCPLLLTCSDAAGLWGRAAQATTAQGGSDSAAVEASAGSNSSAAAARIPPRRLATFPRSAGVDAAATAANAVTEAAQAPRQSLDVTTTMASPRGPPLLFSNLNMFQPGARSIVSRQTSMGSTAGDCSAHPGYHGSLGVASIGGRSDALDPLADAASVQNDDLNGRSSMNMLNGLPYACMGTYAGLRRGVDGGGTASASYTPADSDVDAESFPGDVDAELLQLHSVVQAAAARVTALCHTRRLQRRLVEPRRPDAAAD